MVGDDEGPVDAGDKVTVWAQLKERLSEKERGDIKVVQRCSPYARNAR
jgi:hypothetical protein